MADELRQRRQRVDQLDVGVADHKAAGRAAGRGDLERQRDRRLPGDLDGFEFMRELRRLPGGSKPKVVFCTTENDVTQIARAIHAHEPSPATPFVKVDCAGPTPEDIEKMVQEAEKFKDEDNKIKARIEAKNGLENYIFQMKNTLNDEKLKDKFTDADKKVIEDAAKEGLQFVESAGESATADEFNKKLKDIEGKFNPIMMRVYQAAGGAPGAGGMPGGMGGMM